MCKAKILLRCKKAKAKEKTAKEVNKKAKAKEKTAKATKSALAKLTKAQLEEKAKELGITIEGKVLKADLVEQVFKAQ